MPSERGHSPLPVLASWEKCRPWVRIYEVPEWVVCSSTPCVCSLPKHAHLNKQCLMWSTTHLCLLPSGLPIFGTVDLAYLWRRGGGGWEERMPCLVLRGMIQFTTYVHMVSVGFGDKYDRLSSSSTFSCCCIACAMKWANYLYVELCFLISSVWYVLLGVIANVEM